MDPEATVLAIRDAILDGDPYEARYLARELSDWLRAGGFAPEGWTREYAAEWAEEILRSGR
jgi:hypothetical protein